MSKNPDKLGPLVRAIVGLPTEFHGVVLDAVNRLNGANGRAVKTALTKALHEVGKLVGVSDTTHLRFVEAVELMGTSGSSIFVKAKDKFPVFFDQDFFRWGTDVAGPDTGPATALVYEMTKDGNLENLFSSLGPDWQKRLPTQGQAIAFCEYHLDSLRQDGYGTFFPFRVEGVDEVFVARVHLDAGQLKVLCFWLSYDKVWDAGYRRRVVVLQHGRTDA